MLGMSRKGQVRDEQEKLGCETKGLSIGKVLILNETGYLQVKC